MFLMMVPAAFVAARVGDGATVEPTLKWQACQHCASRGCCRVLARMAALGCNGTTSMAGLVLDHVIAESPDTRVMLMVRDDTKALARPWRRAAAAASVPGGAGPQTVQHANTRAMRPPKDADYPKSDASPGHPWFDKATTEGRRGHSCSSRLLSTVLWLLRRVLFGVPPKVAVAKTKKEIKPASTAE
mmetsp:Transcript_27374/g.82038  ORF Transcript_27374/g.82038 Transcript_27374/m.82038 type:complete len:187 (-) Transcript_27374:24-584(-)